MSPAAGTQTTGQPLASALTSVPWPAWQITSALPGIALEYEIHSTRRAFAGTGSGSYTGLRFQAA